MLNKEIFEQKLSKHFIVRPDWLVPPRPPKPARNSHKKKGIIKLTRRPVNWKKKLKGLKTSVRKRSIFALLILRPSTSRPFYQGPNGRQAAFRHDWPKRICAFKKKLSFSSKPFHKSQPSKNLDSNDNFSVFVSNLFFLILSIRKT